MIVYRIENLNGKGPYSGDCEETIIYRGLSDENFNYTAHPSPQQDKYLCKNIRRLGGDEWEHSSLYYGFSSLNACREWFYKDEWLDDLELHGFKLVEIEIPSDRVAFGEKQLAFEYRAIISKTDLQMQLIKDIKE